MKFRALVLEGDKNAEYACDDKRVFWGNRLLNVDRNSFKVLEDGYAEDKYHYINGIVVTKKKDVEANRL